MRYDYSVVRFVPDSFRAEFVNVGLIVGNPDTGEWKIRRVQNGERASRFRNGAPLTAVWAYLDDLDELAGDLAEGDVPADGTFASGWLDDEHRRMQNLVQLSRPLPIVADTVDDAMSRLWNRLVVDPDRRPYASAQPSRAALLGAYRLAQIDRTLIHENCVARVGHQRDRLDFVIGNGRVAQIAHAWSFRGQSPGRTVRNIKAWSWTLRDVRDRDGRVLLSPEGDESYVVDGAVPIDVVHDEPDTDDGRRALDEAREVLEGLEVTPHSTDDVDRVAENARERLRALGHADPAEGDATAG